jgi:hypothetical protein
VVYTTRRNTDASISGGAAGMSVEASVMDAEQSGSIVWSRSWTNLDTRMST